MNQLLTSLTQQMQGARPQIQMNKNTNALTVRATMPVLKVFEQVIRAIDYEALLHANRWMVAVVVGRNVLLIVAAVWLLTPVLRRVRPADRRLAVAA